MTGADDPRPAPGGPAGPVPPPFLPPGPGREPGPAFPGSPGLPGSPAGFDDLRTGVYGRLLAQRKIVLDRPLGHDVATLVAAQLMTLDAEGDGPITLLVNSPGGPLEAAATLLDTLALLRCPVDTTCLGQAGGTAAVAVASGTGRRRAGPGARFSLRLPDIELSGPASRLDDRVAHLNSLRDMVLDRLVTATGANRRLVARDVDRGRSLTASEAVTYGLVDELLSRKAPRAQAPGAPPGDGPPAPGTTRPDS